MRLAVAHIKSHVYIFLLVISLPIYSQKKTYDLNKTYPVERVLNDIDYTEKYLTLFHPYPFQYISKDSLHAFVMNLKTKIKTPQTEMQVRFYIKCIVAKIGCGHTEVRASKKYTNAVKKSNRAILPLNIFVSDSSKLIVFNNLSKDSSINIGDEILAIDEHPVPDILKNIYSIISSDGYNETHKTQSIRKDWFKYYYSFCYGFKKQYTLRIKHANASITHDTLPAISTLKDTLIESKTDTIKHKFQIKHCKYAIINTTKPIAYIDVNSFKGRHWRRFFRKSFEDIHHKNIQNVIIDLRDNGGGSINQGLFMLSYLLPQKIKVGFNRQKPLALFNPKFKMGPLRRLAPIAFNSMMVQAFHQKKITHYFIKRKKRHHHFNGNIYVLINGKSFSMSAITASYLKYKANAILIGEETGGNVSSSNAVISGRIDLPETNIRISIPMYHIYNDLQIKNEGRGVMPTYPTRYLKYDVLNGKDLDLQKALELIN